MTFVHGLEKKKRLLQRGCENTGDRLKLLKIRERHQQAQPLSPGLSRRSWRDEHGASPDQDHRVTPLRGGPLMTVECVAAVR
jgi:hypothetical protein